MPQETQDRFEIILVAELAQDPVTGMACAQYSRASVQINGQPPKVVLITPSQDPVGAVSSAIRQAVGSISPPAVVCPAVQSVYQPPVGTGPIGGLTPWAGVELDLYAFQKKFKSRGTSAVRGDKSACAGVLCLLRMIETKRTLITLAEIRDPVWLATVLAILPAGWKIHPAVINGKDEACNAQVTKVFRSLEADELFGLRGVGCYYFGKHLTKLVTSLQQTGVATLNAGDFNLHQLGDPMFDPCWADAGEPPVPTVVSLNELPTNICPPPQSPADQPT